MSWCGRSQRDRRWCTLTLARSGGVGNRRRLTSLFPKSRLFSKKLGIYDESTKSFEFTCEPSPISSLYDVLFHYFRRVNFYILFEQNLMSFLLKMFLDKIIMFFGFCFGWMYLLGDGVGRWYITQKEEDVFVECEDD